MPVKPHTRRLFYQVGYTATFFSLLAWLAKFAGRSGSHLIARTLAKIYTSTQPEIVRVVAENLRILTDRRPDCSEAASVFENYACALADYLWLGSRPGAEGFQLADLEATFEHLRSALADKRGAILVTGHYGFFEYGVLVLGQMGFPVSAITHAEPSSALTRWRAAYRARWGAETIELGSDSFSSLRAVEALERGRLIAMLADRPNGSRAMDVPFPGRAIPFALAPALLSWMTGCAIIPVCVRKNRSGRYSIISCDPVRADKSLPRLAALEACTRSIASALLAEFSVDPLQWYQFVPLSDPRG